MTQFSFPPSITQARQMNAAMHAALSDSMAYLAGELSKHGMPVPMDTFTQWQADLKAGALMRPSGFGAYYDLIEAIQSDKTDQILPLFKQVIRSIRTSAATAQITHLGRDYSADEIDRFVRYMGNGKTGTSGIAAPSDADAENFAICVNEALAWIEHSAPEFAREFHTLISEIILVAPDGSSDNIFEGGSCFKLLGGLFLNAESDFSIAQMVTSLAHEAGHSVLFGACREHMLVENPDTERFWSPIRQTERPLEGIFHATFVSARMIWILRKLEASAELSADDRAYAGEEIDRTAFIYEEGLSIVRRHARLTPVGSAVLAALEQTKPILLETV